MTLNSPQTPSLTLFCFALNEELLIEDFLRKSAADLRNFTNDFEIIFHNDGSTDRTLEIAEAMKIEIPQLRVFDNGKNLGVGYCCIDALKKATKDWVFVNTVDAFWDTARLGDFIPYFLDYDLVAGVRLERKICYSLWRQFVSWTNFYLVSFLFNLKLRDIQNVHFYKTSFASKIPVESTSSFIGPEILIKAQALGLRIKEVPMRYVPRQGGKAKGAKMKYLMHTLWEIARFWIRWNVAGGRERFIQNYSDLRQTLNRVETAQ